MKRTKGIIVALSLAMLLTACGAKNANTNNSSNSTSQEQSTKVEDSVVKLHRAYLSPHGDKSVARVIVATSGDKILAANIDELQFLEGDVIKLPNSDKDFGKGFATGKSLVSKKVNSEMYSKLMAEKAGATKTIKENYEAIENFVKDKSIKEVEDVIKDAKDGEKVDAVSGATLKDTKAYLQSIVDAAKDDKLVTEAKLTDLTNLSIGQAYSGNGDGRYVTDAVVLKQGDKIVAANIDELFFMEKGEGVPNSDKDFGKDYANPSNPLASKKVNNEAYSKMMQEYGKATKTMMENYKAIEDFAVGKTAKELTEVLDNSQGGKIDAVSTATLAGTDGLIKDIIEAANN